MGAYDFGHYKEGMNGRDNARLGQALVSIKKELAYNGFSKNLIVDSPVFGEAAANRLGDFQESKGLTRDEQAGPETLKELFRKRVEAIEDEHAFSRGMLGKQIWLESAFDPAAVGQDDHYDTGMAQINLRIHSDVSYEQAYDPAFALNWAAEYIFDNETRIASELNTVKAARASYNIGVEYAKQWLLAGFPASGGPLLGTVDSFKRATDYINFIDKQTW